MVLLVAALGLAIGSFLNVVIFRLRNEERGWRPRSQCPQCHAVLAPTDLIPVVSFIALKARCRSCRKPISWQYPLVEAVVAALLVVAFVQHGGLNGLAGFEWLAFVRDAFFVSVLTVVFVIDLLDMVVFDSVTLPAAAIAFVVNLALGKPLMGLLLAMAVGGGFFLLQWVVSRGRWIGGGDVRIGAMMGAMLGFPGTAAALLLAYVIGALVAVVLLAFKKTTWSSQMAFGTFLSVATVIVLFWGDRLWNAYAALL